jgi:hypothetical protein
MLSNEQLRKDLDELAAQMANYCKKDAKASEAQLQAFLELSKKVLELQQRIKRIEDHVMDPL